MRNTTIFIDAGLDAVPNETLAIIAKANNGLWGVEFPTLDEKAYLGFGTAGEAVNYAYQILEEEGLL